MFLLVMLFMTNMIYTSEPAAAASVSSGIAVTVLHAAEDALCTAALNLFERGTDAVIAKYVKPHLSSMIHEAANSPTDRNDSPPHVETVKRILSGDLSVESAPKDQLKEIVLAAVQKTLEEKEKVLESTTNQMAEMFTPKATIGISTASGLILAIIGSLAGAFGTKSHC